MNPKIIAREELYEAVWSKTLKVLAREWNTTYARLIEACQEMAVPRPDQGYWQLVAKGFIVEKQPLPENKGNIPSEWELLPQGVRRERNRATRSTVATSDVESKEMTPVKTVSGQADRGRTKAMAPPEQQGQELDVEQIAERAVLDMIRQKSQIDFWRESISDRVPATDLHDWLGLDKIAKITEGRLLRAVKNVRKDFRTFYASVTETNDRYNPANLQLSVEIHLRDECEWKDAWEEAWSYSEKPNPHCLSDNALRLYEWAKSPKNTGKMMARNMIGAQARLRETYSQIERHLEEIQLKADPNIQCERESDGWRSQLRIWFECVERRFYHYGPLNPALGLDAREISHAELERFKRWLYDEILKPGFPDGKETVGIFDIRDRKTLKQIFKRLPDSCGHYGSLPDFFDALRLIETLEIKWSFEDGGGPWIVTCAPEAGATWKEIKARLEAKSKEIPLAKRYKLSSHSRALLQWILDLRKDEFLLNMTPPIEERLKKDVGIEVDWEEGNTRAYLELLVEEINEHTEFNLRTIAWHHYSDTNTRILVNRKKTDLDEIVRAIQLFGLRHDRLLNGGEVRTAINDLMSEK